MFLAFMTPLILEVGQHFQFNEGNLLQRKSTVFEPKRHLRSDPVNLMDHHRMTF